MKICDLLSADSVILNARAPGKRRLLEDLARRAGTALGIEPAVVLDALLKREGLGSTGMGDGVALPHARLIEVQQPFGIFARVKPALPFDAIDNREVDLVFVLLLPESAQGEQLNALACVARCLRNPDLAASLRRARDASGLYALLTDWSSGS